MKKTKKVLISVSNISLRYKNSKRLAIKDLSLKLKEGEVVAVLGPSGCGKSTLISLINGGLTFSEAEFEKENLFIKKGVTFGTVFQVPSLMPWRNVLNNISYPLEIKNVDREERHQRALLALERIGLSEFKDYRPSQLSLGMQQRVNLARVFCADPDVMLFDEPLSALDIKNKRIIMEEIKKALSEKKLSAIYVTHSIEEAVSIASRIIVLSKGPAVVATEIENAVDTSETIKRLQNAF